MTVLVKMPIQVYLGFLGRCTLASREFAALKNSVVENSSIVEVLCHIADAMLILDRATRFYPVAAPFIEEALAKPVDLPPPSK